MGLGLTAANLICKVLNGNLNLIRSERNVGSKFNFTMQVKLGSDIVQPESNSIEEKDEPKSSPTTNQRVQTQSSQYNLNELLLRQTSLCHLEKTLIESQQEFKFGQQSGEEEAGESEEEHDQDDYDDEYCLREEDEQSEDSVS